MATYTPPKPNTYVWIGKNKQGVKVTGEMTGNNPGLIKLELRRQGILPVRVSKKSLFSLSNRGQKIQSAEIGIFMRQLATLLSAGIPLVQAFEIVARGQANESLTKLLLSIRADLESGNPLAGSLKKHARYFDGLICSLIHAGEQSGTLTGMLTRIASYRERLETIKGKIKKAMFYPAAVVTVAIIVSCALLVFIVPQFETVFQTAGVDLPMLTRTVISLSKSLQHHWWLFVAMTVGLYFSFKIARQHVSSVAIYIDKLLLKLPILGDILKRSIIARFTRTLATTFAAGMPLVEALQAVSAATGNRIYEFATLKIKDDVATGQQLQAAMRTTELFPSMVVQMVAIGEESGALEQMLNKVADFYEEQVNNAVDSLSTLMEPLIMVVLGVIVGTLIIAMYLPIFKLGNAI